MQTDLHDLAALLNCPRCRGTAWGISGDRSMACSSCGASYRADDGVLALTEPDEDPGVVLERAGVHQTERDPALGGINNDFDDLSRADGELKDAILALPYGNDSRYYREPGYFANVRTSIAAFDFVVRHLDPRAGDRLLDLGADLTWSTSCMARRGLRCTAVDINHHLSVGRLFTAHYGAPYHLVRADMRRVSFRDATFDVVMAVNALHHSNRIGDVARNIARMLKPGGRLGFIEPYCASEAAKAEFGRSQIAVGISEQTYLLEEWHDAFSSAGLVAQVIRVRDSFSAVYRKPQGVARLDAAGSREALFAGFYRGRLEIPEGPSARIASGRTFTLPLLVENRSNAAWCTTSEFPVYTSYHLYRVDAGGRTLIAFDNPRTRLAADVNPGEDATVYLEITAPGQPGEYAAEIDLVHEYVSWFAEKGMRTVTVRFTVE